jgi:hypothetical protein
VHKKITRSKNLGFHPIDVYMNWPFHFQNIAFIDYFTKYESNKLKHPSSKYHGEDNLGNYIYITNKLTKFTNFHPTYNIEGFCNNILLQNVCFQREIDTLHIQFVEKLCTCMPHSWTCTWFRKNTNVLNEICT